MDKSPPTRRFALIVVGATVLAIAACGSDSVGPEPSDPTPSNLVVVSGGGQEAVAGALYPEPVVLRLTSSDGSPVHREPVSVEIEGSGWIVDDDPRTDPDGRVHLWWYAGVEPGTEEKLILQVAGLADTVQAQVRAPEPGQSYLGHRSFVEYIPGTLPFVITAPHGGTMTPDDLPDRSWGTTVRDAETDVLAYALAEELETMTGARPHLVILHLRRTKLDANRALAEAAQGDEQAERAWHEFHHWTRVALGSVKASYGQGFYMDLHGHGKHDDFELGYLLTRQDLDRSDAALDGDWAIRKSSLRTLAEGNDSPFSQLVRGEGSLGALFEAEGYTSIPSPRETAPGGPFFSGGYNTQTHACREGGTICGYQLELNRVGVRDTEENRRDFARAHARVMEEFFRLHYGIDLTTAHTLGSEGSR